MNETRKNHHPCFAGPAQADCVRAPLCWLAGLLSALSAAPATGRERHIWVKRAGEGAKGDIKNAELPHKN